jgi:hypothetical protein
LPKRGALVPGCNHKGFTPVAGEQALDSPPSAREIRILRRQRHDRMQMIRKDHDGADRERPLALRDTKGEAQRNDVVDQDG